MAKAVTELKPNYGPVYCAAVYPELAKLFQRHGYALAVHGSVARDLDLIAIRWAHTCSTRRTVLTALQKEFAIRLVGPAEKKEHRRVAYTLCIGHGECAGDLSFIN